MPYPAAAPAPGRSLYWDTVKGLGIMAVVVGHGGGPLKPYVYLYHLALFFFVSGYLYKERYSSEPFHYFSTRLERLWWPMVKYGVLFVMLHNVFLMLGLYSSRPDIPGVLQMKPFGPWDYFMAVKKVVFMQGGEQFGGALWFILPLFMGMIIFCCIQNVAGRTDGWKRHSLSFILIAACGSIPRERALMYCIEKYFPGWRECVVHESSPSRRKVSQRLKKQAGQYIPSQYYPDIEPGKWFKGARSENLERMTFEDDSIDLHITQDVMEHVFNPGGAFAEIARTLRPGGAHIFTVPLVNKDKPTEICAALDDTGKVVYLREPEYHVNPVSRRGSLVTMRWGYDICDFIFRSSGLSTEIVDIDSLDYGIRAEFNEVLITTKP